MYVGTYVCICIYLHVYHCIWYCILASSAALQVLVGNPSHDVLEEYTFLRTSFCPGDPATPKQLYFGAVSGGVAVEDDPKSTLKTDRCLVLNSFPIAIAWGCCINTYKYKPSSRSHIIHIYALNQSVQ